MCVNCVFACGQCRHLLVSTLTIYSAGFKSTKATPNLEMFSDLSTLISIRYAHQSEEEANSVRIVRARPGTESLDCQGNEDDSEQQVHPHRPPAHASHDSQRRCLAKEINEIIKASTTASAGESTGLNRRARWKMDKLAAG